MRTVVSRIVPHGKMWYYELTTYDGEPRYERVVGVTNSPPSFDTAEKALKAGETELNTNYKPIRNRYDRY